MEFEIELIQELRGYYKGVILIEAESREEALQKARQMNKEDLDSQAKWHHGDEYEGDVDTIEILN